MAENGDKKGDESSSNVHSLDELNESCTKLSTELATAVEVAKSTRKDLENASTARKAHMEVVGLLDKKLDELRSKSDVSQDKHDEAVSQLQAEIKTANNCLQELTENEPKCENTVKEAESKASALREKVDTLTATDSTPL